MVIDLKIKKFLNFTNGHLGLRPVAVVKKKYSYFIGRKFAVYEKFRSQLISKLRLKNLVNDH